ncbi:hypothetical protein HY629_01765, partial [Candidatus Uhrbacteria bacterium]|nr:hypothetical protein [Candidatus Uhrbacteria bacterium]
VEEALFRTRKSTPAIRFWTFLDTVTLLNGATWMQRSTDYVGERIFPSVAAGETKTVDLYTPYYPSTVATPILSNLTSARVSWDAVGGSLATVQLRILRWNSTTLSLEQVGERPLFGGCQFVNELVPGAYQLQLTPNTPVAQLSVAQLSTEKSTCVKHDGADTIAIPSDLIVRARGMFRTAQQAMEMTFPRVAPW